jgi:hypothetical protein
MHEVGMPVALRDAQNAEFCRERNAARAGVVALGGAPRKRARGCAFDRIRRSRRGPESGGLVASSSGSGLPRASAAMRFKDGARIANQEVMKLRLLR